MADQVGGKPRYDSSRSYTVDPGKSPSCLPAGVQGSFDFNFGVVCPEANAENSRNRGSRSENRESGIRPGD